MNDLGRNDRRELIELRSKHARWRRALEHGYDTAWEKSKLAERRDDFDCTPVDELLVRNEIDKIAHRHRAAQYLEDCAAALDANRLIQLNESARTDGLYFSGNAAAEDSYRDELRERKRDLDASAASYRPHSDETLNADLHQTRVGEHCLVCGRCSMAILIRKSPKLDPPRDSSS